MEAAEKVRILIVDDKPDKAKALAAIVSELGETVTVHSGKDALRCLMGQNFAVILLDVNMPIMDGFETAEHIRRRQTSERMPIIFITSYYDAEIHRARAYTLGAVDYIMAPVIPEILQAKVSVFADLFRKNEEVRLHAEERVQLMQEQMARVASDAARVAAEESERRTAFLAEASRVLASSLDYEDTLQRVAQFTIPELCDWCTVNIFKDNDELQCLAVASRYPERIEEAKKNHLGLLTLSHGPMMEVVRSGEAMMQSDVSDSASPKEAAMMLSELGVVSYMIVPLRARDRTLGALTFLMSDSKRNLTENHLSLADDLGRRAASAIDNARLYKEAQLANRMKDDFLAVVSHELRTPLTPILGWVKLLQDPSFSRAEFSHGLDIIERNARVQSKLIEDLLDVSRIIAGKLRLKVTDIELDALLSNSIESLQTAADLKRVRIERRFQQDLGRVSIDADRIQQVIWNLLSNAIKFTPENGTVEVSAFRKTEGVVIKVKDSGRGIDTKFLPHVFDRFRQADSSITRAFGGLGIGLSIVKHLVELHGGTVGVESKGLNRGSIFTVTLPLAVARETRTEELAAQAALTPDSVSNFANRLEGMIILVVDDEPDCRHLLTMLCERNGAQVWEAASAREAFDRWEKTELNLIISDIGMAGEDGYCLIKKIRSQSGVNAKIPAIALTAYARDEDKLAALSAGFQAHLVKPINQVQLIDCAAALARSNSLQSSNILAQN